MPVNMTNTAIGALIEQVEHNCKFSDQGCGVKMMLKDLVTHEKKCPDRTIQCPFSGCAQLVAWGDKVQFLDLRAALPFLGALDYIF